MEVDVRRVFEYNVSPLQRPSLYGVVGQGVWQAKPLARLLVCELGDGVDLFVCVLVVLPFLEPDLAVEWF